MKWAEERRANRAAAAEQARLDADAESRRRIAERAAVAEESRAERDARATRDRAQRAERRKMWARRWAGVRGFASAHRVAMLIYPLAVASAVLAIPAMAAFGVEVYDTATGTVLPVLSELGMWAFALAVQARRRQHPDAPVWALQAGVWAFAAVAFALNALHGAERGASAAVVMGIASVAGVVAHQLVTASRLRSRAERQTVRVAARQDRKVARVRRAAVRHAVAELDTAGHARLVHQPGRYVLTRPNLFGRARLTAALEPPDTTSPPGAAGCTSALDTLPALGVAEEAAAWLTTQGRPDPGERADPIDGDDTEDRGPIATLNPGGDQRKSRPDRGAIPSPNTRSLAALRAELAEAVAADPDGVDPGSAESIRRALRCSPARARQLRDEHRQHKQEGENW